MPLALLCSCIQDEAKNMECDILEAWVEGDNLAAHFYQATDMRQADIPSDETKIVFTVRSVASLPKMPICFRLTPGATISPASGTAQDFSGGAVTYTVTSEDGQWQRTYQVSFRNETLPSMKFDFENYELNSTGKYYVWYEQNAEGNREDIWATGNGGFIIAKPNAAVDDYPSVPDPDGYEGCCIRLTTRDTGSWGTRFRKPIAAGNFFLGEFDSHYALTNTLWCTKMGIPFTAEPVNVKGYYKYVAGESFTDKEMNIQPGRTDEPNIYAVLYRNHNDAGEPVVLHGDDVMSSPLIVRKAQVAALPPTDTWTPFEMTFETLGELDADLLRSRGYSLAMVFSSSKTGDTFEGAVGSTLWVDKVEISINQQ